MSSRFRKLSHSIWHCQYHIVWVPKYRFRVLRGNIREALESGIQAVCGYAGCEVVELNVQPDHVHLVVMIPPKVSISRILCRHRRNGCGHDTEVCPLPGETGAANRTITINRLIFNIAAQVRGRPLGGRPLPPNGGWVSKPHP